MTQITTKEVVPEGNVEGVHPETRIERLLRLATESVRVFTASFIALGGFIVLLCVLYSGNPEYVKYHDAAWSLILTMIGGALGYMFAIKN